MKQTPEKCPWCDGSGVIKMSYHHQIAVLKFPSTLKSINPVVHMHKLDQPKPVHPDLPPGVKVRIESTQEEQKENEIFVRHSIWVEEAPAEVSVIDVHLDIEEVLPSVFRGDPKQVIRCTENSCEISDTPVLEDFAPLVLRSDPNEEVQNKGDNTEINDLPILEAPRIHLKENCDDSALYDFKPQLISRGTQTEEKYFPKITRTIGIQTDRVLTKRERFNVIKQLDALVKIMDWVDAVSRSKKHAMTA